MIFWVLCSLGASSNMTYSSVLQSLAAHFHSRVASRALDILTFQVWCASGWGSGLMDTFTESQDDSGWKEPPEIPWYNTSALEGSPRSSCQGQLGWDFRKLGLVGPKAVGLERDEVVWDPKAVWFGGMVLLSEDFLDKHVFFFSYCTFQVSHNCRSGVQEMFDIVVGDGASQVEISDRTTEGSSKKVFFHRGGGREGKLRRQQLCSSVVVSGRSELCHQSALSSSRGSESPQLSEAAEIPGWGTIKGSQTDQSWSPNSTWEVP